MSKGRLISHLFDLYLGLTMSQVEPSSSELDSMRFGSARNSTRVWHEPFF